MRVQLTERGTKAFRYNLDGTFARYAAFDDKNLRDVALTAGDVAIFRIVP